MVMVFGLQQFLIKKNKMNIFLFCVSYFLFSLYHASFIYLFLYNKTINKLHKLLLGVANCLNIPVTFHDDLGKDAGVFYWHSTNNVFIDKDMKINIDKKYSREPSVLAHELGHYLSIKKNNDTSERGADQQALELCNILLTKTEKIILSIYLNVMF